MTRSKRDIRPTMNRFALTLVIGATCVGVGHVEAQSKGASGRRCENLIELRVQPLHMYACKVSGSAEMARIAYNRVAGNLAPEEFPKTAICQEELIDIASKAYRETLSCLERTKQTRAVELLENYYAAWLMHVRSLTKAASTGRQYNERQEQLEEAIEEKKLKLALALR